MCDDYETLYEQACVLANVIYFRLRDRLPAARWARLYRKANERVSRRSDRLYDCQDAQRESLAQATAEALWEQERRYGY